MKAIPATIRSHVGLIVTAAMILGFISSGSLAFAQTTTESNWDHDTSHHQDQNDGHDGGHNDQDNDRGGGDRGHGDHGGFGFGSHFNGSHHDWYRSRWNGHAFERYFDWMSYCQWFASTYGYLPSASCPIVPLVG